MTWILTLRWIDKLKIVAIALGSRNLSLYIGATLAMTLIFCPFPTNGLIFYNTPFNMELCDKGDE
jgi:hypothetical protein